MNNKEEACMNFCVHIHQQLFGFFPFDMTINTTR